MRIEVSNYVRKGLAHQRRDNSRALSIARDQLDTINPGHSVGNLSPRIPNDPYHLRSI